MKLDLSRYEGHTPGPWLVTGFSHGSISLRRRDGAEYTPDSTKIPGCQQDRNLIEDAPLLLAYAKELEEVESLRSQLTSALNQMEDTQ